MDQTHLRARSVPAAITGPDGDWSTAWVLATTTVAGLLLGPVDLLAQTTLPYPWANLANSGAVWALAAFVLGSAVGRAALSVVAGLVLLPVAVESYYLAGVAFRHDSTATLWSSTTGLWLVLAVVVGPLAGLAGGAVRSSRRAIRCAAAACGGAIFLVEAVAILARSDADGGANQNGRTAVVDVALAVAVPIITLTATRSRR